MKKLICEMCGSVDLIKQDGAFVCQHCGCKYSVEEAKKMMIEGPVDVSGSTVKVDTSKELEKLYQIAHTATEDSNFESAAKYYDMILVQDPTSWEAYIFSTCFNAMGCKIGEIQMEAFKVSHCIDTALHLIKDHVSGQKEQESAVSAVSVCCGNIMTMFYKSTMNYYSNIDVNIKEQYTQEMVKNCTEIFNIAYVLGNSIVDIFPDHKDLLSLAATIWETGITIHKNTLPYMNNKEKNKQEILSYIEKVKKYDPSYEPPELRTSNGGCYIATCVYGSYDCPQVWTLRRYRDYTLAETWRGCVFIRTYYAISPIIVKWFGETAWFKNIWKPILDRMVARLQDKGVQNTPYEDRQW